MTKDISQKAHRGDERGFTLIEMIVAVALFSIVMLVSVGTLLALVGANRKAQALQSVMNNLNVALDGMVRSIRMGSDYHCGGSPYTTPRDCDEDTILAFKSFGGETWIYWYAQDGNGVGRLYKSETGSTGGGVPVTAPEVEIDSLKFYVIGTTRGVADAANAQPKVVIVIKGTAGGENTKTSTTFSIQATAVQRILDL